MTYIDPDLLDDETAVAEANLAAISDRIDGWEPHEGNIETVLAEAFAVGQATTAALVKDQARLDYAAFGETVLGITRRPAQVASTQATIEFTDADGHTLPAGYEFVCFNNLGDTVGLVTLTDATTTPGNTTAAGVPVAALEPGAEYNGAFGAAIERDPNALVSSVTLEQPTAGGADEQPLDEYVNELAARVRRRSFLPLTPDDYADAALEVPGVHRVLALNRHDPGNPGDHPGHLTIVAADAAGNGVSAATQAAIVEHLSTPPRILGVQLHTQDPEQVVLDVRVIADAADGYTHNEMVDAITDALTEAFNKATWAADPSVPGGWNPTKTQVTIFDVAAVIDDLPQVATVNTIELAAAGSPVSTTPVALTDTSLVSIDVIYFE